MKRINTISIIRFVVFSLTIGSTALAVPEVCLDTSGERREDCPGFLQNENADVCTVLREEKFRYAYECTELGVDGSISNCDKAYCTIPDPSKLPPGAYGSGHCSGTYYSGVACNDFQESIILELEIVDLVNAVREDHGLPPLEYDPQISNIAEEYATDYICPRRCTRNCHNLDGKNAGGRLNDGGIRWWAFAENLHYGDVPPEIIVNGGRYHGADWTGWMDSPDHRDNILDAQGRGFTHIGAAHVPCSGPDKWIINLVKYPPTLSPYFPWKFGLKKN